MRIVELHEKTVSIASPIANAYIDFAKMTCSVVAVVTDVVRDGRRVVGYGFNSNGRYGQGALLRERFFPRLLGADPRSLVDAVGTSRTRTSSSPSAASPTASPWRPAGCACPTSRGWGSRRRPTSTPC